MSPTLIITLIVAYFLVLIAISYFTSRNAGNDAFFVGERKSPWYLVSFGMIGASLSGVTFLSVPGWVGSATNQMSYMQVVFGYFIGYIVVAYVLMPIYYRMNLTSIYEYLEERFGWWSYKTGAVFFLLSRVLGSAIRLMLVAQVLQSVIFDAYGIPFWVTTIVSVLLIWIYTNRGGIKTIVWTDTFQTAFMLLSVILTVILVADALELKQSIVSTVVDSNYSQVFFTDDFMSKNHFLKSFLGGMFITIGMTGLDQDMMQKNLSCKSIGEAKKNMMSMATVLVIVNFLFLGLGALLYMYAEQFGVSFDSSDQLFSTIAMSGDLHIMVGVLFILGLIAAAYSSADSALTALTTSFYVDILGKKSNKDSQNKESEKLRKLVHIGVSITMIIVVIIVNATMDKSAIDLVLLFAGFTYGPLIGLFFFGILTKTAIKDSHVPIVSLLAIVITVALWYFSASGPGVNTDGTGIFGAYKFGAELIVVNSIISFFGLYLTAKLLNRKHENTIG